MDVRICCYYLGVQEGCWKDGNQNGFGRITALCFFKWNLFLLILFIKIKIFNFHLSSQNNDVSK